MKGYERILRTLIRRLGFARSLLLLSLAVSLVAVALTAVAGLISHRAVALRQLGSAFAIAWLIAPPFFYLLLRMLIALDASEERYRRLSIVDDLTRAYNRRYFIQLAEQELDKARRYGTPFSVILLDIDHFKAINERCGHFAGDAVLEALARTCMKNLRSVDTFARVGGEEFAFLIPESGKVDVQLFARRIQQLLAKTVVLHRGEEIRFTVSLGVKTYSTVRTDLLGLLRDVDFALYKAKAQGRNCIVEAA